MNAKKPLVIISVLLLALLPCFALLGADNSDGTADRTMAIFTDDPEPDEPIPLEPMFDDGTFSYVAFDDWAAEKIGHILEKQWEVEYNIWTQEMVQFILLLMDISFDGALLSSVLVYDYIGDRDIATTVEIPSTCEGLLGTYNVVGIADRLTLADGDMRGVFQGMANLEKVVLPESLMYIGQSAFRECAALEEINLPQSLLAIADRAFQQTGLTKLSIPESVLFIDKSIVESCTDLSEVTFYGYPILAAGSFFIVDNSSDNEELQDITIKSYDNWAYFAFTNWAGAKLNSEGDIEAITIYDVTSFEEMEKPQPAPPEENNLLTAGVAVGIVVVIIGGAAFFLLKP